MLFAITLARYGAYTVEAESPRAVCAALALLGIEAAVVRAIKGHSEVLQYPWSECLRACDAESVAELRQWSTTDDAGRVATAAALDSLRGGGLSDRAGKDAHVARRRASTDCACRAWAMARRLRGEKVIGGSEVAS